MLKLAELLLRTLLPLLERYVRAAEAQAEASVRQEALLRSFSYFLYSEFRDQEEGLSADEAPVDVTAEYGTSRDLKAARLEELRMLWFQQHGEILDDEQLMAEYERLYTEAEQRLDADTPGDGVTH